MILLSFIVLNKDLKAITVYEKKIFKFSKPTKLKVQLRGHTKAVILRLRWSSVMIIVKELRVRIILEYSFAMTLICFVLHKIEPMFPYSVEASLSVQFQDFGKKSFVSILASSVVILFANSWALIKIEPLIQDRDSHLVDGNSERWEYI